MQGKVGSSVFNIEFVYPKNTATRITDCKVYISNDTTLINQETPRKKDIREKSNLVLSGIASCHSQDNFCKDTGRKYALKRALDTSNFTKSERSVIWNTYLNRKNESC
jgi:hypothetical protein